MFLREGADHVGPLGDAELLADPPEGRCGDVQLCRRVSQRHTEVLRVEG